MSLINQDSHHRAIVYVSSQSKEVSFYNIDVMFDYEAYMRMFQEVRKLGEGGYGLVFLAKHCITWEEYAVKIISPNIMKANEASKAFKEA
jgi:serine/threonine protein kinase